MKKKKLNDYFYFIEFEFMRHNQRCCRSHLFMTVSSLLRGVYHSIDNYPELDKLSFSVIKVSDKNKSKTVLLPQNLYLNQNIGELGRDKGLAYYQTEEYEETIL